MVLAGAVVDASFLLWIRFSFFTRLVAAEFQPGTVEGVGGQQRADPQDGVTVAGEVLDAVVDQRIQQQAEPSSAAVMGWDGVWRTGEGGRQERSDHGRHHTP